MSENNINKDTVYSVSSRILNQIASNLDSPANKAILANLRNSISKSYSQSIEVFSLLYEHIPESFISSSNNLSFEEKAILTSLQIFAIHQQGNGQSVLLDTDKDDSKYNNMGFSLKALRVDDNVKATDRRFNTMITADTFEEFTFHLRQLVNLLKSRTNQKVNYAKLAQDLYFFQIPTTRENIKLPWAKQYYRYTKKDKKNKGESNE